MSITQEFAKAHASAIVGGPFGETIRYRSFPNKIQTIIRARVSRGSPVASAGPFLENQIEVFVSKADVPEAMLGKDEVQLEPKKLGEPGSIYVVTDVLSETAGSWHLMCSL